MVGFYAGIQLYYVQHLKINLFYLKNIHIILVKRLNKTQGGMKSFKTGENG